MPLFTTIDELKQYVTVDANLSPESFLPSMQKAEDKFIAAVLGTAQYNDLLTAYQANSLSQIQSNLLDQVRKAEASLGLYMLLPVLSVRIGDSGVLTSGGQDQQRAMQWQVDDVRNQLLFDGYDALDNLYRFLFDNQNLYPDWQSSSAYNQYTQFFINSALDFQTQVDIDSSNWLFRKLVPLMNDIEQNNIMPTIGQPFFSYLKAQISGNTLSGPDVTAVQLIQAAVARLTFARGLLDPNFSEVVAIFLRPRSDAQDRRKWEKPDYTMIAEQYRQEGENALEYAKSQFNINASSTVYVAFFNSDRYRQPLPADKNKHDEFDNRNSKGSFMMM